MQCNAIQYDTIQYNTIQYNRVNFVLFSVVQCCVFYFLCCLAFDCAVLCFAVLICVSYKQ